MSVPKFRGIIPPVATIFSDTGKLDYQGMGRLMDTLIDAGTDGLFILGSSGEFSQMSAEQRKEVAEFTVQHVNKRVPVLVGTGSNSTREAISLTKHAQDIGADGVIVVNPSYWVLREENLFRHYCEIAESTQLPMMLYNFPDLTGQDLSPDFVLRLVEKYPNVVGIKETVDQAGHIREMIIKVKRQYPHFSVFCGYDDHLLNTLTLGGDGAIPASCNFAPELTVGIYRAFINGEFSRAIELHRRLSVVPLLYKIDSPFANVIKEAIRLCGLSVSTYTLPPTRQLSAEQIVEIRKVLEQAGLTSSSKMFDSTYSEMDLGSFVEV